MAIDAVCPVVPSRSTSALQQFLTGEGPWFLVRDLSFHPRERELKVTKSQRISKWRPVSLLSVADP